LYDVAVEKLAGLQGLRGGSRSEREEAGARARIIMAAQSGHRSETGVLSSRRTKRKKNHAASWKNESNRAHVPPSKMLVENNA
jgi:hypothetical protein